MPSVGDVIAGKYRIDAALSSGGMGSVFVGSHLQTKRQFAIKVMSPLLAGDEEAEARFFREAKLTTAIDHPSIIRVYDVGREGERNYMVMELLKGESLGQRIKRGPLSQDQAVEIMLQVLDGVAAAHRAGVIHRDLKPDNIFLCASGDGHGAEPKVLDFGISKLMTPEAQTRMLTQTGIALGTPLYMSAEQVRGERDIDARTDVYALGVILHEMLLGQVPYLSETYPDLVLKIISGGAPPIRNSKPGIHPGLDEVVTQALALDAADRFQSVQAMTDALLALGIVRSPVAARIASASPPAARTPFTAERRQSLEDLPIIVPRRRTALYVVSGLGLLLLLGLGLVLSSGPGDTLPATAAAGAPPAIPLQAPATDAGPTDAGPTDPAAPRAPAH